MQAGLTVTHETIARFWSKVQIPRQGGCWIWTASRIRGYGQFKFPRVNGQQPSASYAHRFAYEWVNGPIPNGLNVCHRCDTPLCVRPDHLFLGTQQDNLDDARRKGRLIDGLGARKLSDADYQDILTSDWKGVNLAKFYGVTKTTISRIRNGHQGRHTLGRQRVLQDKTSQSETRLRRADVLDQSGQVR